MRCFLIFGFLGACLSACASAPREPFNPNADPRIGEAVKRACFSSTGARPGGYVSIDGYDGFLTGDLREKYLLVFSRGCGNLDYGGDVPVFTNYGDNCRRVGEPISTAGTGFRITGGCTITDIYRWNDRADQTEDAPSQE